MTIGQNIKKVRDALGLTQAKFADKLGVSRFSILAYEKEDTVPSSDFYSLLITIFDVNINWIFTGKGNMFMNYELESDAQKLRKIYPGLPDDPVIDDLVESLQVPIMSHAMIALFLLKRKEYQTFMDEYFEGENNEKKTTQSSS